MTSAHEAGQRSAPSATRTKLQRIDTLLRRWAGVSFDVLASEAGMPADLLRARAKALGLAS